MGVIQNSMNTALATLMGGMLGIQHIKGQQEQLKSSELKELVGLEEESIKKDKELSEAHEKAEGYSQDLVKHYQGKFKTYLPNDRENPIWVDKSVNQEEWSTQKQMAERGLFSANQEIEAKFTGQTLIDNRIKELKGKYGDYIGEKIQERYEPNEPKTKKSNGREF